jgi:hypothetical protein
LIVLADINLIHFFDFYLALVFLASILLRIHQYRAFFGLMRGLPGRWPRLMQLMGQHRSLFVTRATVAPALLALGLILLQTLASRLIWPDAAKPEVGLTLARLIDHWPALIVVSVLGATMLGVDIYATVTVAEFDRPEMEKYFDQAEYWLKSWTAPVVSVFTLGYINPRRMVAVEVRNALEDATRLLNNTLWWVCGQTGLRVACGLSLWITYAWTRTT